MFPTVFLSHGSPMLALTDAPARDFLRGLGATLGRPRAIIVASAHWETQRPVVSGMARNSTIHDFYGFPQALFDLRYEPPGAPGIARVAAGLLTAAGLPAVVDPARGLDHGAWVPLLLMYPEADVPVFQVSLQREDPAYHLRLGQALAPLREQDVLIVGSGSFTHDLSRFRRVATDAPEAADVAAFGAWFDAAVMAGRTQELLEYRRLAPFGAAQHPTEEHLLPFYVALGAAGEAAKPMRLHSSAMYSILRMDAYAFG
jgi:4,5-DOPA dioxygenase extradiol